MKRRDLLILPAAGVLGLAAPAASAQQARSLVRFLCPFNPGALHDHLTRILAEHVGRTTGRTTIVENRPGSSGLLATRALQNYGTEGATTLLQTYTGFVSLPIFLKAANYDPIADFAPVAAFGIGATVVLVHGSVPAKNIAELIAYTKTLPNGLEAATTSPGGWGAIWTEIFARRTKAKIFPIAYKGGAEMSLALQTGEVKMMISVYSEAMNSQVKAGNLKLLAVTSERRSPLFPGVPTINETVPGFSIETGWFGLQALRSVPKAELALLGEAVKKATMDPTVKGRFQAAYAEARFQSPAEYTASMLKTQEVWKRAALELNIAAK